MVCVCVCVCAYNPQNHVCLLNGSFDAVQLSTYLGVNGAHTAWIYTSIHKHTGSPMSPPNSSYFAPFTGAV